MAWCLLVGSSSIACSATSPRAAPFAAPGEAGAGAVDNPPVGAGLKPCSEQLDDYTEVVGERSSLRIERGFLNAEDAEILAQRIDVAVPAIEEALGSPLDRDHYGTETPVVHLFEERCIPHAQGSWSRPSLPHVFLSLDDAASGALRCGYVHELVHIVAWEFYALWLREGLAVYLNDELGGYRTYPNWGRDLHAEAQALSGDVAKEALLLLGEDGIPRAELIANPALKKTFYIYAGSLVRYLWEEAGREPLLRAYSSEHPAEVLAQETGRPLDVWKDEWQRQVGVMELETP